jgi:hypothetical protein
MNRRRLSLLFAATAASAVALAATSGAAEGARADSPFTVHEWGTFTSIAGADGRAAEWLPLSGPQDLPCFVERSPVEVKITMIGTVRMETPVLYFYAPAPVRAAVGVGFRQGAITEWYPHAAVTAPAVGNVKSPAFRSTIDWTTVDVRPETAERFPVEAAPSHYYAARATDAAPVIVSGRPEKFLFYRGVGGFQPPLTATIAEDGHVTVQSTSNGPLGDLVLFTRRGGLMAYAVQHVSGPVATFQPIEADGESAAPLAEIEAILRARGLYEKEARAMIATWRDSWFEDGTRLFYVAPGAFVDETLPLTVAPAPASVARVFVGRVELTTADQMRDVRRALTSRDTPTLVRYGRFLQPIADRIMAGLPAGERQPFDDALAPVYAAAMKAAASTCPTD